LLGRLPWYRAWRVSGFGIRSRPFSVVPGRRAKDRAMSRMVSGDADSVVQQGWVQLSTLRRSMGAS